MRASVNRPILYFLHVIVILFFHKHRAAVQGAACAYLPFTAEPAQFLACLFAHLIYKASKLYVCRHYLLLLPLPLEAAEGFVDVYHVFSKKEAIPNLCWDSLAVLIKNEVHFTHVVISYHQMPCFLFLLAVHLNLQFPYSFVVILSEQRFF